ncbi:MAG: putative lipid II flippase FtsW [Blastococcus sp.]
MTTSTRPRTSGAERRPSAPPNRNRPAPRRLRGPAWLDGPMTSCHLVLGAAGLLLTIGLVMVFSASSIEAALAHEPVWAPGVQQVVWAFIGILAMLAALRMPAGFLRRWSPIALIGVAFLLLIVLVPGIGMRINGARQWFNLGVAHLQPSEVAKLVFALWGAHVLALRERYMTTKSLLVPVIPAFGVLSLLLIAEPDFGSVVSLGLVLAGLLWGAGMPLKYFGWATLLAAGLIAIMIQAAPYRMARVTSFLHPFADQSGSGFQAVHGMYALATGGFWGVGLGNSAMKWDLLPHAESDYIFAIIGEELGFLGCLVVVTLYGVLAYAGFRIARRSADRFIQLASVAITVWLIGQAAMNMGYVVGLLPVTGVQLPLISAGGTSLVLTLFIVGLLARFARSEPAAIESERTRTRSRISRLLLPVPAAAVDPVRPRHRPHGAPPDRPRVSGGRTVISARGAPPRRHPSADERPGVPDGAPVAGRARPVGERRPSAERRPSGERRPEPASSSRGGSGRRQPPSGGPRRPGGAR